MSNQDRTPLDVEMEFAENPESRCACILLLDTSASMQGDPIDSLNEGLRCFAEELKKDDLASRRVEVAVVQFNSSVEVVQDFVTASDFEPPLLETEGLTSMGAGIETALDMIEARKNVYKNVGVSYYRPWVFMITDGAPTDSIERAISRVQDAESGKRVAFFAVGVQGADMNKLCEIADAKRPPLALQGLKFVELFCWLSGSLGAVGQSQPGEMVALATPSGWAQMD